MKECFNIKNIKYANEYLYSLYKSIGIQFLNRVWIAYVVELHILVFWCFYISLLALWVKKNDICFYFCLVYNQIQLNISSVLNH